MSRTVPDSYAPPLFNGMHADAYTWLAHLQRYMEYRQLTTEDVLAIFQLFVKDTAIDWYERLSREVGSNLTTAGQFLGSHHWTMFLMRGQSLSGLNDQVRRPIITSLRYKSW